MYQLNVSGGRRRTVRRHTWEMSIFVTRWQAGMLLKKFPTSLLSERSRFGANTVERDSAVIWLLSS